ncbi:carboxymuconolactone decarboxylase family protein [Streptomyces sp. TRM 70351]|uniref:carboxymuconolactone decarboxylase family protein n=1 Tax=Streptomyces sp. TRM 70351 TaxID=3116552 RepID=UPI002E7C4CED|nr:carboxymuconolactone decarboxylase family protein [Streptomyces sp. TRM 70351]MEE1926689.1 carboxymuconolactone decarboxylase family protein [Streptomyces sp. TRM 70351]
MNEQENNRLERGRALMRRLSPHLGDAMTNDLNSVAPDFGDLLAGFAFADVWARPALPLRERALVRIAALTALGAPATATGANIDSALQAGLSLEDVSEAMLQTLPYAGFPHVIAALEHVKQYAEAPAGPTASEGPDSGGG